MSLAIANIAELLDSHDMSAFRAMLGAKPNVGA